MRRFFHLFAAPLALFSIILGTHTHTVTANENGLPSNMQALLETRMQITQPQKLCEMWNFKDMEDQDEVSQHMVLQALQRCIVEGRSSEHFVPDSPINRAEIAKIIVLNFNLPHTGRTDTGFYDVDPSAWYASYIYSLKTAGIVQGYEDGSFRPGETITMAEMLKTVFTAAFSNTGYIEEVRAAVLQNIEKARNLPPFVHSAAREWFFPYAYLWDTHYLLDHFPPIIINETQHKVLSRKDAINILMTVTGLHEADYSQLLTYFLQSLYEAAQTEPNAIATRIIQLPAPEEWEPRFGAENAPISIITYIVYGEPYGKRLYPELTSLVEKYGNQVNLVIRPYTLPFYDGIDHMQALAVHCVAALGERHVQQHVVDALIREQVSPMDKETLLSFISKAGINKNELIQCFESQNTINAVDLIIQKATKNGVLGAPTSFIYDNRSNRSESIPGAQPAYVFETVINDLLD